MHVSLREGVARDVVCDQALGGAKQEPGPETLRTGDLIAHTAHCWPEPQLGKRAEELGNHSPFRCRQVDAVDPVAEARRHFRHTRGLTTQTGCQQQLVQRCARRWHLLAVSARQHAA